MSSEPGAGHTLGISVQDRGWASSIGRCTEHSQESSSRPGRPSEALAAPGWHRDTGVCLHARGLRNHQVDCPQSTGWGHAWGALGVEWPASPSPLCMGGNLDPTPSHSHSHSHRGESIEGGAAEPCSQLGWGHILPPTREHCWSYKPPMVIESGRGSLTWVIKLRSQRRLVFVAPHS